MRYRVLFIGLFFVTYLAGQSVKTVIFLAGKSKRFQGENKILTPIADKPISWYPINASTQLNLPTTLVLGHQKDKVKKMACNSFPEADLTFSIQDKQLGTGHALQCTQSHWQADNILVLNGDHPLTSSFMLSKLITSHEQTDADVSILIAEPKGKCSWGRIIKEDGKTRIVEAIDFNEKEHSFTCVNAGYYLFKRSFLEEHINELWLHENKGEYYVTDLVEIANRHNLKVNCVEVPFDDVFGINTQEEFAYAEKLLHERNNKRLASKIFKEYDIRGIVDQDLHIDQVYELGKSFAYLFKTKQPTLKTVAVGMDGRTHSSAIKERLVAGLQDSGLDVIFIGLCHSPGLYFAMHTLPVDAGIMITASHNPKEYNGFKICLGTECIWGRDIKELYACYQDGKQLQLKQRGTYKEYNIIPDYVTWLKEEFKHLHNMNLSAIIDCGNGAGGAVIPSLIKAMGWQHVKTLYAEVDGTYPHHEADPVKIENMQDLKTAVQKDGYDVGIGLDGDADRMAPITPNGLLVSGDLLLGIYAQAIINEHENLGVVFDVKSSSVLIDHLNKIGAQPHMSATGHVLVKSMMKETGALLAGEVSCHFCFKDRYFGYDDGVYAMLRLFELLEEDQKTLDDLVSIYPEMHTTPEYRIACPEDKRSEIINQVAEFFSRKQNAEILALDGVRATLPYGWGLLRASNTEPVLSMRFESSTVEGLKHIKNDFTIAMRNYIDRTQLRKRLID